MNNNYFKGICMKNFLLVLILPLTAMSQTKILEDNLVFSRLGIGFAGQESRLYNCVSGTEVETPLTKPKVIYNLRKEVDLAKVKIIAEMIIVDKVVTLQNVVASSDPSFTSENFDRVCGDSYVSKLEFGAKIYSTITVSPEEANEIPEIQMIEGDSSKSTTFVNIVNEIRKNIKTATGSGFGYIGSQVINFEAKGDTLDKNFEEYKIYALATPTARKTLVAETALYTKDLKK